MKCIEKHSVVEFNFVQWTGENEREMFDFLTDTKDKFITLEESTFRIDLFEADGGRGKLIIKNPFGEEKVYIGDYILKNGPEIYHALRPNIFNNTYKMSSDSIETINIMAGNGKVIYSFTSTSNSFSIKNYLKETLKIGGDSIKATWLSTFNNGWLNHRIDIKTEKEVTIIDFTYDIENKRVVAICLLDKKIRSINIEELTII